MAIHVFSDNKFALIRCHKEETESLREFLVNNQFVCGTDKEVDGIPRMVDIDVGRKVDNGNVSWETINGDDLRDLLRDDGFDVRS